MIVKQSNIRVVLAISTLTIEPMMFLWAVAGGIVKVSQDQMIMYKVGGTYYISRRGGG